MTPTRRATTPAPAASARPAPRVAAPATTPTTLLQLRHRDAARCHRRLGLRLRPAVLRCHRAEGHRRPLVRWRYGGQHVLHPLRHRVEPVRPRGRRPVAASGTQFRNMDWADSTMNGSGGAECLYRGDIPMATGATGTTAGTSSTLPTRWPVGPEGKIYRIHTSSDGPGQCRSAAGHERREQLRHLRQRDRARRRLAQGLRPGRDADVHPAPSNSSVDTGWADDVISEFYLAQIEEVHAGKTVEIQPLGSGRHAELCRARTPDPRPDGGGWTRAAVRLHGRSGHDQSNQRQLQRPATRARARTPSSPTRGGSGGIFNGCWLTIRARSPSDYDADQQDGWWKIRYT